MIPAILGKKVGMTQIFKPSGERVPVTLIEAGPCVVLQVKSTEAKDKYDAVQLGFDDVKLHRATMADIGHTRKAKTAPKRFVREIRLPETTDKAVGDLITVHIFKDGDVRYVDVVGISKGKGFQGAMKRWGFGGQPASHGCERKHRSPGSITEGGADRQQARHCPMPEPGGRRHRAQHPVDRGQCSGPERVLCHRSEIQDAFLAEVRLC
jgi:large subunit ribosomal protein L3